MDLPALLQQVRACTLCAAELPLGPRPVLRAAAGARIMIVGQAPGRRVHETGIPWNDPSGDRLRVWLGLERETFYDESRIAIIPTAFCYPGSGRHGDLPPSPRCAPQWHPALRAALPQLQLTLLVGTYAQAYYLGRQRKTTLAHTVMAWQEYAPQFIPLPHPSPRNQGWFKQHPWLEADMLPQVRQRVHALLAG